MYGNGYGYSDLSLPLKSLISSLITIIARLSLITVVAAYYEKSTASPKASLRPSVLKFYVGLLGTHTHNLQCRQLAIKGSLLP